jgi:RNA polymerase sigma factor (sigma-70 family)
VGGRYLTSIPLESHPSRPNAAEVEARRLELVIAAQGGDEGARHEVVAVFFPLIQRVARIYRRSTAVSQLELTQEGVVGVLRALERFDPDLGTPFWAYASWWVRQAMQHLVSELTGAVVLSDRAVRQLARVKGAMSDHMQTHGDHPTTGELAFETGLSTEQVEHLVVAERRPRALEEPVGDGEGGLATFGDLLADPDAEEAYNAIPQDMEVQALVGLLSALNARELTIVRGRFGLDGPERTLRDLGSDLGVSAERVRQIEERALEKMRDAVAVA